MNFNNCFILSHKNKLLIIYKFLFFVSLAIALCAASIMRIGWPDNLIDSFYHIRNLLFLFVYILLIPLVLLSVIHQYFSATKYSEVFRVKDNKSFYLIQAIVLLMCLFSFLGNKNRELFTLALLAGLSWPIRHKSITFELLVTQVLVLIAGFVLLSFGVTRNYSFYEHGIRHVLGFSHPNCLGISCFSVISLFYVYSRSNSLVKGKLLYLFSTFSLIITIVMYYFTKSRTSTIAILLLIFLYIILHIFSKIYSLKAILENKPILIIVSLFPFICFISAVLGGLFLDYFQLYSSNFNYRFYEGIWGISRYGLSLFGMETENLVFDNNYFRILIWGGVANLIYFLFISSVGCYTSMKRRDYYYVIFLIVFFLFQEMESYSHLWPLLFLVFSYVFSDYNVSKMFSVKIKSV